MVTYGGMSKKPVSVSTSSFIFKVKTSFPSCLCLFSLTTFCLPVSVMICLQMSLQDLSFRGFWLQKWMTSDKANECRNMIDYLLCLAREEKLKYE